MVALFAVWALLAQAILPAFHHHDAAIGGWHQPAGPTQPDQDDEDDCPLCQAIHAIGSAVLPDVLVHPGPLAVALLTVRPESFGRGDRGKADRPRQRAPPTLI